MRVKSWAGMLGVTSAFAVLAVAEVAAVLVGPQSSPFFAVGSLAVDLSPLWLKETMIAVFGTGDKIALFVVIALVLLAVAVAAGIAEVARKNTGIAVLLGVSALAVIAVTTRADASGLSAVPTVVGMLVGAMVLRRGRELLVNSLSCSGDVPLAGSADALTRRRFFRFVGGTAAAALIIGVGARLMNASTAAVSALRAAITLPSPAVLAPAVPTGAQLDVQGITPLFTPNADFYRIDIALQVPQIDPTTWELRITGMVENPVTISYSELLSLPLEEHITTIACVSNVVGGDLIGNATWLGYPIRDLLARAKPTAGADMVLSSGPDGFTAGTPITALTDPDRHAILAVAMNGEPLPTEHGFPARMIVPGLYGYVSATKWITTMEVTTFSAAEGYWTPRGWSALGPVKTQSRIDTPRTGQKAQAGTVVIAGVAWAQHTGIAAVEVQIDQGDWQRATLATEISDDTWVQWSLPWSSQPGSHTARVRATDKSGYTQTASQAPPAPNGATGWDTISFTV